MRPWRIALAARALGWVISVEWRRRRLTFCELIDRIESTRLGARSWIAAGTARSAVRRVSRLLPRGSCLRESLASVGLLRSLGYPARLAIGVKGTVSPLEAHAWVEVDGIRFGDESPDYRRLMRSPGA